MIVMAFLLGASLCALVVLIALLYLVWSAAQRRKPADPGAQAFMQDAMDQVDEISRTYRHGFPGNPFRQGEGRNE